MSKMMVQYTAWNPLKYYSANQTWEQYKITGRYQETADQREMRDYLNVARQILKELEGEERLKSEEGAYLNYATSSINDKAEHLPLVQFIYQEVTEGKLVDPTVRVYIKKGFGMQISRFCSESTTRERKRSKTKERRREDWEKTHQAPAQNTQYHTTW